MSTRLTGSYYRLLLFKPFARLLPIWGCLLVGKWPPGFQADATLAAAAGGGCAAAGAGAPGVGGLLSRVLPSFS